MPLPPLPNTFTPHLDPRAGIVAFELPHQRFPAAPMLMVVVPAGGRPVLVLRTGAGDTIVTASFHGETEAVMLANWLGAWSDAIEYAAMTAAGDPGAAFMDALNKL
jgi:hypothetical protein